jgi:chemotaxis response regulator CheB
MRVLVVDDEPLARTALSNILSARNDVDSFEVASDAVEAMDKLGCLNCLVSTLWTN